MQLEQRPQQQEYNQGDGQDDKEEFPRAGTESAKKEKDEERPDTQWEASLKEFQRFKATSMVRSLGPSVTEEGVGDHPWARMRCPAEEPDMNEEQKKAMKEELQRVIPFSDATDAMMSK